jgi:sugar phosphate isomerase/epimerase
MEISIITDEIDQQFAAAVETGCRWGVTSYEIRKIDGKRVPEISPQTVDTIIKAMARYSLRITALSPGLLKRPEAWLGTDLKARPVWWEQRELYTGYRERAHRVLEKVFGLAHLLKTSTIIIFAPEATSGEQGADCPEAILELLREAAVAARRQGLILALENEADCWADTGKNTLDIVNAVNEENLKVNWDPANAYLAGEIPYPHGYEHVRKYVCNVHAKDALPATDPFRLDYELIGKGMVDWRGQLRALRTDAYNGHVCIETHSHPLKDRTFQNFEILRELIAATERD